MKKNLKWLLLLSFIPMLFMPFSSKNHENNGLLPRFITEKAISEANQFISYWMDDFRKDDNGNLISICDISKADYLEMFAKYTLLSTTDRKTVDATPDYEEGFTIKDSIKELVNHYSDTSKSENKKPTLAHSTTIIVVVSISVFGMTVICIFFALKNVNLIQ